MSLRKGKKMIKIIFDVLGTALLLFVGLSFIVAIFDKITNKGKNEK